MTSSLNNVMSMTLDDYFRKGHYDGEIYKTVNMRNLAIAQYCKDSTAIKQEQEKIELQLKDFRTNLWNTKSVEELRQDSIKAAEEATAAETTGTEKVKTAKKEKEKAKPRNVQSTAKREAVKKEKANKSKSRSSGTATQISVRRERR